MQDAGPDRERAEDDASPSVWSPAITVAVTLFPGVIGVLTGQLLLFPSLGPTVVMQAHLPRHGSSRFYNIVVAHLVGLAAGDVCVFVLGLAHAPSVFAIHALSPARVIAVALSLLLAITLEITLRASHPPAAATTLLVALGSFKPNVRDSIAVVAGVLLVAAVGELVRQSRLRSS